MALAKMRQRGALGRAGVAAGSKARPRLRVWEQGVRQDRAGPRTGGLMWPDQDNGDMAKVVPAASYSL